MNDVSMTNTNIAIASRMPSRGVPVASSAMRARHINPVFGSCPGKTPVVVRDRAVPAERRLYSWSWASCGVAMSPRASGFSCARSCCRSATTSGSRTSRASGPTRSTARRFRVRQTFVLEDASGDEVARIQERKLSIRDKIAIERDGDTAATVHKALVGIRDRFAIDVEHGADMKAHGNVVDHEYEIERDGDTVATISKKWFRVRDVLRRRRRGRRGRPAHPRDHRRHRLADHPRLNTSNAV